MIPAKFDYKPAQSKDEAISLLGEYGDEAKLLAGGHSLLPLMKLRLATPEVLIDISGVSDLSYIDCLLYTSPSPRDATLSRMPSSA